MACADDLNVCAILLRLHKPVSEQMSATISSMVQGIGIAVINTVSSLGGFAGPYLLGALRQSTGNFQVAMGVLAACLGVAAIVLGEGEGREGVRGGGPRG